MRIPVFVSGPTKLSKAQERSRDRIMRELARLQLEPRALGRSDYPSDFPLREVYVIAKHCSGGIILGFRQFTATAGVWKRGTKEQRHLRRGKPEHFMPDLKNPAAEGTKMQPKFFLTSAKLPFGTPDA